MSKKVRLGTVCSLMALTAAATFAITLSLSRKQFNEQVTEIDRLSEKYGRLDELDAKVRAEFYKEVPEEDVLDGLLAGYVNGLGDRYSSYRSAEALTDYQDNNAGVYVGIGISILRNEDGYATIVSVNEGGSAEKAGIEAGDLLIEVEGISVKESYAEAIKKINGEVGTSVSLRIRRHSTGKEQKLSVMRAKLDEKTVFSEMCDNNIGYIAITKFRSVTVEQFRAARESLLNEGAKGFIFDVRNNGGGLVSAVEQLADPMLPEGELAFSYDRSGEASPIIKSDKECELMPYAILVNGNTASAAELFACLMRDYSGAVLVGEQTFGKGIMQTTFPLSSGGVTLTTATYSTGKSPCYHEIGLTPDIPAELPEDATEDTQRNAAEEALIKMLAEDNAA